MPAREAFGDSELYCSIGPYDSLDHARFDGQLNDKARNALRQALAKTTGQERVVIVGITHDAVDFVYRTYLFEHPKTARATISFADCVGGDGVLRFDRHKDLILLRLATR